MGFLVRAATAFLCLAAPVFAASEMERVLEELVEDGSVVGAQVRIGSAASRNCFRLIVVE